MLMTLTGLKRGAEHLSNTLSSCSLVCTPVNIYCRPVRCIKALFPTCTEGLD